MKFEKVFMDQFLVSVDTDEKTVLLQEGPLTLGLNEFSTVDIKSISNAIDSAMFNSAILSTKNLIGRFHKFGFVMAKEIIEKIEKT